MRVTVLLPGMLRPAADGLAKVDVRLGGEATLATVLDVLGHRYPGLERRLRDDRRGLRRYVNFYVDGEECRQLAGADTTLRDGAEIQVIPSVAGG